MMSLKCTKTICSESKLICEANSGAILQQCVADSIDRVDVVGVDLGALHERL